jgi:two-component system sensor histidine kinase PilS (NtrC family)
VRYTPAFQDLPLHLFLDPRRIVRWVWLGRVALVCAVLVAAAFVWADADPAHTLVATLAFAGAVFGTAISAMWADIYKRPVAGGFYLLQCAMDLLLVTAVVHITGGWSSQFGALYILVIAVSALLLERRSGHVVAFASCVLYVGDVLLLRNDPFHFGIAVQATLFMVVGLGAEAIASRLRHAGVNREELAARLAKVQLEAADILRTIRSGIITVDSQGRLLYANPAAADLLGIHLRGYTGKPVLRALLDVAPELSDLLERSARDGLRTTRAEGVIRRDGMNVPIGVTTTTIERDTKVAGQTATAIFQDISDTKRVQALHVRAERLQAVAELSASLAHEIRNPLASIRSATEQLAARRAPSPIGADDDDERTLHSLVVREADRLDRLLTEFLDFARARVTRTSAVNIASIIDNTTRMVRAHPSCEAGVVVSVDSAIAGRSLFVEGDEDLLHRALFNLLLNAAQILAPVGGGNVTVSAICESDSAPAMGRGQLPMIRITVTDDGPGVPYELRERLFDPFVTGRAGGSGLGLSVVHRAVEAHNGVVYVDHLHRGTRFTILIPAADDPSATDVFPSITATLPDSDQHEMTLYGINA